jgi:hypothetical protein
VAHTKAATCARACTRRQWERRSESLPTSKKANNGSSGGSPTFPPIGLHPKYLLASLLTSFLLVSDNYYNKSKRETILDLLLVQEGVVVDTKTRETMACPCVPPSPRHPASAHHRRPQAREYSRLPAGSIVLVRYGIVSTGTPYSSNGRSAFVALRRALRTQRRCVHRARVRSHCFPAHRVNSTYPTGHNAPGRRPSITRTRERIRRRKSSLVLP